MKFGLNDNVFFMMNNKIKMGKVVAFIYSNYIFSPELTYDSSYKKKFADQEVYLVAFERNTYEFNSEDLFLSKEELLRHLES